MKIVRKHWRVDVGWSVVGAGGSAVASHVAVLIKASFLCLSVAVHSEGVVLQYVWLGC